MFVDTALLNGGLNKMIFQDLLSVGIVLLIKL